MIEVLEACYEAAVQTKGGGKVTAGLTENKNSLPPGLWLRSAASCADCRGPGSAPERSSRVWQAVRDVATICPAPASWTLTLKVVSKSHVMWAISVRILVFLGLSVLDLARCTRQTYVRRQTSDRHQRRIIA